MKKVLSLLLLALISINLFAQCATVTVNNQCIFTDAVPVLTLCGVSPAVVTGGDSNAATITVGAATLNAYGQTVPVLQCVATFATAFTHAPVVTVSTSSLGFRVSVNTVSTTALVVQFSGNAAGQKFSFTAF